MKRTDELRNFWATESLEEAQREKVATDWSLPWDDRHIAKTLDEFLGGERLIGKTVLDFGCGVGRFSREALRRGAAHVYAIDVSQEMLGYLEEYCSGYGDRLTPILSDGYGWEGVPDGSADVAFSFLVFQHLWSYGMVFNALSGMTASLRPGGLLTVQLHRDRAKREQDARGFVGVGVDENFLRSAMQPWNMNLSFVECRNLSTMLVDQWFIMRGRR